LEELMKRFRRLHGVIALGLLTWLAVASWACLNQDLQPRLSELCSRNEAVPCANSPDGGAPTGGLVGYTCPREARPDMDPHYAQGIPQGLVCGDLGAANSDDTQNYCCSAQETTCAFNPVAVCPQNTFTMLLTGAQQVPANDSPGTATVMVSFNDAASSVSVSGSFANLSSGATMAHIHGPAGFGEEGGVAVMLSVPAGNPTSGGVSGTAMVNAEQMNFIRNGGAYLDIHTANYPKGELRAQIRSSFYGFQCRGANRPEALNPLIDCGNGVREDDFINYCCTARPIPPPPAGTGCVQSDGQCTGKMATWLPDRMSGWTCTNGAIPSAEDFKANESRADFYYFLCATPTTAPNPSVQYFCCYVPALIPPGGSCVPDLRVPGCAANRFGFSCYGRDTPEDDFLVVKCDAPTQTTSADGYPAKTYCCDIKPASESK
jgi:hypothetical protein